MTRRLALVVAALALVTSGCGSRVRDDVWNDLATQDGIPTATTTSPDDNSNVDGGQSGTIPATDSTPSAKRDSGRATTAATLAGPLPAPADGTYTYDETSNGDKTSTSEKWTAQRGADSVALTSVETEHQDEDTVTTTARYRVTRSVFELLSQTSAYNDEKPETCTYKPPVLALQLPLAVGEKWQAKGACSEGGQGDASGEDLQLEVTGTATDIIGGQAVKTFLVKGSQSFDSTDDTTGQRSTFTFTDTRHIDPSTLLVVVEDVKFDFGAEGSTIHRQLRSLNPS
jgi:hypothetical protein